MTSPDPMSFLGVSAVPVSLSACRPAVVAGVVRVLVAAAALLVAAARHAAVAPDSTLSASIELQLGLWAIGLFGYLFALKSVVGSVVVGAGLAAAMVWLAPLPATMGPEGFAYVAPLFLLVVPTLVVAVLGLLVQRWERR